jgi:catechol 2,3-dioxygenase-like lactoylglutathione lyase family enzyme
MLDHIGIEVGDLDRSRAFYRQALEMTPTATMSRPSATGPA